jgi:hypothetical protein
LHVGLADVVEYPRPQQVALKGGPVVAQGDLILRATIDEFKHGFGQALLSNKAQIGNVDGTSQTSMQTRVHDRAQQAHVTSLSGAVELAPVVAVMNAVVIGPENAAAAAY